MGGETYTIKLTVISASSLVGRNPDGLSNPYVIVNVGSQSGTTAPKMRVLSADFDHTFQFVRCCLPASLRIRVMSSGADGELLLGAATMTLITPTEFSEKTLPLSHGGDMVLSEIAPFGCGTVKISYEITETPKPAATAAEEKSKSESSMPAEAPAVIALGPPPPTAASPSSSATPQPSAPSVIVLGGPPPPPSVSVPTPLLPPPTIPAPMTTSTSFPTSTTAYAPAPPPAPTMVLAPPPVIVPPPAPVVVGAPPPSIPGSPGGVVGGSSSVSASGAAAPSMIMPLAPCASVPALAPPTISTPSGLSPAPSLGQVFQPQVSGGAISTTAPLSGAAYAGASAPPWTGRSVSPTGLVQSMAAPPPPQAQVPASGGGGFLAAGSAPVIVPPLPQFAPMGSSAAGALALPHTPSGTLGDPGAGGVVGVVPALPVGSSQSSLAGMPPGTIPSGPFTPPSGGQSAAASAPQHILHPAAVSPGVSSLTPAVMAGVSPLSASAISTAGPQQPPPPGAASTDRSDDDGRGGGTNGASGSIAAAVETAASHSTTHPHPRGSPSRSRRSSPNASVSSGRSRKSTSRTERSQAAKTTSAMTSGSARTLEHAAVTAAPSSASASASAGSTSAGSSKTKAKTQHPAAAAFHGDNGVVAHCTRRSHNGGDGGGGGGAFWRDRRETTPSSHSRAKRHNVPSSSTATPAAAVVTTAAVGAAAGAAGVDAPPHGGSGMRLRRRSTSRGAYQRVIARDGERIVQHPHSRGTAGRSPSPSGPCPLPRVVDGAGPMRVMRGTPLLGVPGVPPLSWPPLANGNPHCQRSSSDSATLALLYSDAAYLFRSASTGKDLNIFQQIRRLDPQLDRGFVRCRDFSGRTLLHIAAWHGRIDVMEVLLAPMMRSGGGGAGEMMKCGTAFGGGGGHEGRLSTLLIDLRALLTTVSRENVCHTAAKGGQSSVVVWLRSQFPAVTALLLQQRNARGLIPAECAKECGFSSVAEMLIPVC